MACSCMYALWYGATESLIIIGSSRDHLVCNLCRDMDMANFQAVAIFSSCEGVDIDNHFHEEVKNLEGKYNVSDLG